MMRRRSARRWTRPDATTSQVDLYAVISLLPRSTLVDLADRIIDRMDAIDGDPDLEHTMEDWEENHDREYAAE